MIRLNGDNFIGFDLGGFRSDFLSEIIRAYKILYSALIYLTINSRSIGFFALTSSQLYCSLYRKFRSLERR